MLQEGLIHPDELPPRPYGHFKVGMGSRDAAGDAGGDGGSAKSQAASGAGRDETRDAGARQTSAGEYTFTPHRIRKQQLTDPRHAQSTVCARVGEEDLLPGECPALFMHEGNLFDRKWWQEDDGAWLPQANMEGVDGAVGAKGSAAEDSALN